MFIPVRIKTSKRPHTTTDAWLSLLIGVPILAIIGLVTLPLFGLGLLFLGWAAWGAWKEIKFLRDPGSVTNASITGPTR